ncbi:unnamed protein product, partial [Brenthis ino]
MPAHTLGLPNNLINIFKQTSVDDVPKIHHPKAGANQYRIFLDTKNSGSHEVKTDKGMVGEEHEEKKGLYPSKMPHPFGQYGPPPAYNTSSISKSSSSVLVTVTTTLGKDNEAGLNENSGGKSEKLGTGDFKKSETSDFGPETNQMVINKTVQVYSDIKKDESCEIIVDVKGLDFDPNMPKQIRNEIIRFFILFFFLLYWIHQLINLICNDN